MEILEQEVGKLNEKVNGKIWLRLIAMERDFKDKLYEIRKMVETVDAEFKVIKGPLLDDFKQLKS